MRRRDLGAGAGAGGGEGSRGATFCLFVRLGGDTFAVGAVPSGLRSRRVGAFRFRDLDGG